MEGVTCWYCYGDECEDCDWTGLWPYAVSEADIHPAQRDVWED